ncbi:hypothetical protein S7711_01154 [Stachybotrys chartarum IBT 7711]|uniref:DUF7707 domain-containing protein n=1 Tax=Stachybotrys chartarum (strain CBS 109288 / IBT 7711) TaxID=1280523 RepID=A0A084ASU8_STACB|nr:hypothetical protein S7711_01154 [Stachybotrys chartarum IBT 7711]KFA48914.1 hypothetical protein S40293_02534 [Stachybotrys chartarum IBT 40293]KFA72312.1 hypothetical protein S40288_02449 [Stachybotrys chartarum IBT 40288]
MVTLRTTLMALALGLVSAQDYYLDPDTVNEGLRGTWCDNQLSTCPLICRDQGDAPDINTCDPDTLQYECICEGGDVPDVDEYSLTLPYFLCQEWGNRCVTACGGNSQCASDCREDNPCGARNPTRANTTSTSATAGATASRTDDGTTIFTGNPGSSNEDNEEGSSDSDSNSDSGDNDSAAAVTLGRTYGLAIVFGTLFAGFAML